MLIANKKIVFYAVYTPQYANMTCLCLVVAIFVTLAGIGFGMESVSLTSTLADGEIAVPQQVVIFTCIARSDSIIIHWSSVEYIGPNGDRLDLLSHTCETTNVTNGHDPNTYATCTDVTAENGQNVFVSTLHIVATLQHPTASVTCRINTNGPHNTTTFQTRVPESVSLTSTLADGEIAVPQQVVIFTCIARSNSIIIHWSSDEYIGPNGDRLDLLSHDCERTNVTNGYDPNTYATCTSVSVENGQNVFVSTLRVIATLQHPTASVTCEINGNGPHDTATFQTQATVDSSTAVYEVTTSVAHSTSRATTGETVVNKSSKDIPIIAVIPAVIAVLVVVIAVVSVIIVVSLVYAYLRGVRCKPCYRKVHDEEKPKMPGEDNKVHNNGEESKI